MMMFQTAQRQFYKRQYLVSWFRYDVVPPQSDARLDISKINYSDLT